MLPAAARASIWRRGGEGASGQAASMLNQGDSQHAKVSSECGDSANVDTGGQVGRHPVIDAFLYCLHHFLNLKIVLSLQQLYARHHCTVCDLVRTANLPKMTWASCHKCAGTAERGMMYSEGFTCEAAPDGGQGGGGRWGRVQRRGPGGRPATPLARTPATRHTPPAPPAATAPLSGALLLSPFKIVLHSSSISVLHETAPGCSSYRFISIPTATSIY